MSCPAIGPSFATRAASGVSPASPQSKLPVLSIHDEPQVGPLDLGAALAAGMIANRAAAAARTVTPRLIVIFGVPPVERVSFRVPPSYGRSSTVVIGPRTPGSAGIPGIAKEGAACGRPFA